MSLVAVLTACDAVEPEAEYAWALQPVKLSPDRMVVAVGDVIYIRDPVQVRANFIPEANRWSDFSHHELDRCLFSPTNSSPPI